MIAFLKWIGLVPLLAMLLMVFDGLAFTVWDWFREMEMPRSFGELVLAVFIITCVLPTILGVVLVGGSFLGGFPAIWLPGRAAATVAACVFVADRAAKAWLYWGDWFAVIFVVGTLPVFLYGLGVAASEMPTDQSDRIATVRG